MNQPIKKLTKEQIEEVSHKAMEKAHSALIDYIGDHVQDACIELGIEEIDYDQLQEEVEPLMRKKLIIELGGTVNN